METTTNCQWWWFGECIAPGSITAIPCPAKREGHRGWYSRGYLDANQLLQFITFRLHDSVPSELIQQWKRQLGWHKDLPKDSRIKLKLNKRIEAYADKGAGACYLRDPRIARLVQQALEYFDRQRYHLIAWCIMPNHVHVLIEMLATPLEKILQSWKSYTAKKANKLLGRKGRFWMPDYFDRYIRNERHFEFAVGYILENPVRAGLVANWRQWEWSGFIGERDGLGNQVAGGRLR